MKLRKITALTLLFFITITALSFSKNMEYGIRAAYIAKIIKYVTWPQSEFKSITIGIAGEDSVSVLLELLPQKNLPNGMKIRVEQIKNFKVDNSIHILYISEYEKEDISEYIEAVRGKPVLTISCGKGYGEMGVLINFYSDKGKVRFEVNETAFSENNLKISSKLLKLAKVINRVNDNNQ